MVGALREGLSRAAAERSGGSESPATPDRRQTPRRRAWRSAIVVFIWFAADEGGFLGTTWLPGTLLLLATLVVCLLSLPLPRPAAAAVAGDRR